MNIRMNFELNVIYREKRVKKKDVGLELIIRF